MRDDAVGSRGAKRKSPTRGLAVGLPWQQSTPNVCRRARDEAAFRYACAMGLEGIVAMRRDRPYRSGRSPDWIKVKNRAHPNWYAYATTNN
jgi:hypothetical protein